MAVKLVPETEVPQVPQVPQAPQEPVYEEVDEGDKFQFDQKQVEASVEHQKISPESLCSLTVKLYGEQGGEMLFTLRGPHPKLVFDVVEDSLIYALQRYGLYHVPKHPTSQSNGQTQKAQQEHQTTETGDVILDKGTGEIHKITNDGERFMFSVGRFEYPFKDSRKASIVATLFDDSLGFTEKVLEQPRTWMPKDWGNGVLYADWQKVQKSSGSKYYNVIRVHE